MFNNNSQFVLRKYYYDFVIDVVISVFYFIFFALLIVK